MKQVLATAVATLAIVLSMQNCGGGSSHPIVQPNSPQAALVLDTDAAGLNIFEGSTATFNVQLSRKPDAPITVTAVSTDVNVVTVAPASLTIDESNWNTPQLVTLTAPQNTALGNGSAKIDLSSDLGSVSVPVNVYDDDSQGIVVSKASLEIDETGTMSFKVKLATITQNDVIVNLSATDPNVSVSPNTVTFTQQNWGQEIQIDVTANDDGKTLSRSGEVLLKATGLHGASLIVNVKDSRSDAPGMRLLIAGDCQAPSQCGVQFVFYNIPNTFIEFPLMVTATPNDPYVMGLATHFQLESDTDSYTQILAFSPGPNLNDGRIAYTLSAPRTDASAQSDWGIIYMRWTGMNLPPPSPPPNPITPPVPQNPNPPPPIDPTI